MEERGKGICPRNVTRGKMHAYSAPLCPKNYSKWNTCSIPLPILSVNPRLVARFSVAPSESPPGGGMPRKKGATAAARGGGRSDKLSDLSLSSSADRRTDQGRRGGTSLMRLFSPPLFQSPDRPTKTTYEWRVVAGLREAKTT